MINILIADDNVQYAICLMNYINEKSENIRVCGIAEDGKKALEFLNEKDNIDIILLDYEMPYYDGNEVLKQVKDKNKYKDSCIVVTGESNIPFDTKIQGLVYKIVPKGLGMDEIIQNIEKIVSVKNNTIITKQRRNKIISELLYLGYDISHKGTRYLVDAIEITFESMDKDMSNLQKQIYPIIANKYDETVHNVKCSITRETKHMYLSCNMYKMQKYFMYAEDAKPKVKTVINTVVNKLL